MTLKIGILTVSDRSYRGEREDASGPALKEKIVEQGWEVMKQGIVPDDISTLRDTLTRWSDFERCDVILTTGGTGFSPRDITPEATRAIIQREAPGLAEAMRASSLEITLHAMLSRAVVGIRGDTLIVNLPGSPKAAIENLTVILPVLPHAIQLLHQDPGAESSHRNI